MKIKMTITEIHYGDAAIKAIPALCARMHQKSAAAHIFASLAQLSEQTIYQIFNEIPQQVKNQTVSLLCKENHDQILERGNRLLKGKGIPLVLNGIQHDERLHVFIEVGKIDYVGLIRIFLPVVQDHLASSSDAAAALLQKLPWGSNIDIFLRWMPQVSKDAISAYLLNANQEKLCSMAERAAAERGIRLSIRDLGAVI